MNTSLAALAIIWCLLFSSSLGAQDPSPSTSSFRQDRAPFTLSVDGLVTNLSIISASAMPGGSLSIKTTADGTTEFGSLERIDGGWHWTAPLTSGHGSALFSLNGETITLQLFVLTPWRNGSSESLNGYRIGKYSDTPFRGLKVFRAPTGFIEFTPEMRDIRVSPHFTLGQFLCKQQPGTTPSYLLVRPELLVKLELLLERVNAAGHEVPTLTVMSGFRTPWYNQSIGNRTTSSRHLFGGAADVYIDRDGDERMDDLNGDGRSNIEDALILARLAENLAESGADGRWTPGGIGVYRANAVRGPFVHVDARGYKARW